MARYIHRGEDLAALLRSCLPGVEVGTLEPAGEGDFCRAYLLNGERIVRVPKHAEAAAALGREACLLPSIAPLLPVPVPRPELVVGPGPGGAPFAVHECIRGVEATRSLWQGLPEAGRLRVARGVGAFLRALHLLDPGLGRACGVPELDHGARVERVLGRLRGAEGARLPGALRTALEECFARYRPGDVAWRYDPALLHSDLSPEHVLVDAAKGEITGVIDWGDAAIGDPARDFVYLYEDWGSDFLGLALEGYGLEDPLRLLPRVLMHYLAEQVDWTLDVAGAGDSRDFDDGVAALTEAVRDFEVCAG